jgi:hypothetical protein
MSTESETSLGEVMINLSPINIYNPKYPVHMSDFFHHGPTYIQNFVK